MYTFLSFLYNYIFLSFHFNHYNGCEVHLAHFLIGLFVFLLLSFRSSLYILLCINPLSDVWFPNNSSHCILWIVSFDAQYFLKFSWSPIFLLFSFVTYAFGIISKNSLWNPMSGNFCPMISSKSCIVLGLTFRYLIDFQLILYMVLDKYPTSFFYM